MRKDSPERLNVVEAETVPVVEGHVYAVVTQDGDAPPGSWIASRTKGRRRDPGGPTGAVGIAADVPAVSAPNPLGLAGQDLAFCARIAGASPTVSSFDLVEINPMLDRDGQRMYWVGRVPPVQTGVKALVTPARLPS